MRSGYNPTRRNRNIGTARQGHGHDNRLVIPDLCVDHRLWSERLGPNYEIRRTVHGQEVVFLVEETHGGCAHYCTVDDVARVLAAIPAEDLESLGTVVLRQPTRKQRLLNPVWGRLSYSADLGRPGRRTQRLGPAVFLEAIDCAKPIVWSTSLGPSDSEELERLRADGHQVVREGRRHVVIVTPESARATQLFRTLLHEVGHWVDWLEKVERPGAAGGDYDALEAAYFARPRDEREAYAHRYADKMKRRLEAASLIPFAQLSGSKPLADREGSSMFAV